MNKLQSSRGFTLAELLIVVAIIGVLVTIGIPVYGGALKSAHEATCLDHRSDLQSLLTSAYLMDGDVDAEFSAKKASYTCPEGGSISYYQDPLSDDITVRCSIHTPGLNSNSFNKILADVLQNARKASTKPGVLGAPLTTDSTAPAATAANGLSGATERVKAALTADGFNLGELGIVSWRYNSSTNCFMWTNVDISSLAPGDKIPIIRCNAGTGKCTVYTSTVVTRTVGSGASAYTYHIINDTATEYKPSTGSSANGNQTLEKALEYFSALSDSMNTTTP